MIKNPKGQMYIGQSINIDVRFKSYKYIHVQGVLGDSFKKYGIKNHIFSVLEYCDIKLLNEKEDYYIKLHNTCNTPKGLNRLLGGTNKRYGNTVAENAGTKDTYVKDFNRTEFRALRKSKKMSVRKLSMLSNVRIDSIEKYESGQKKPLHKAYERLINVLNNLN